jgi:hypothetical protein
MGRLWPPAGGWPNPSESERYPQILRKSAVNREARVASGRHAGTRVMNRT